jgi:hypothetical protein
VISLRRAGWCLVIGPSAFTLALFTVGLLAAGTLDLRPPAWFVVFGGVIGLAVYGSVIGLGAHLLRTAGALTVTLADGRLDVRSPSRVIAESFTVPVSEIASVVWDLDHESDVSGWCAVLMASGEQHWLPHNLGVDLRRLTGALVRNNPAVTECWRLTDGRLAPRSGRVSHGVQQGADDASRVPPDADDPR